MGSDSGFPPFRVMHALQKVRKPELSISSSANIKLDGKKCLRFIVRTGYIGTSPPGGFMPLSRHKIVTEIAKWPPAESPAKTNLSMSIPS